MSILIDGLECSKDKGYDCLIQFVNQLKKASEERNYKVRQSRIELLIAKIKDDETKIHVYDVMVDTLGSDFNVARRRFFDYSEACDRLAFFDHKDIPKILKEHIPPLVTEVKFSADLSHLTDIREKGFDRGDSSLYYALY